MPENMKPGINKFDELNAIVKRLRGPNGCPWDREQTSASLLPHFLEEVYEVIESVDAGDGAALKEELGDILLHVVFQAEIAQAEGKFSIDDCLKTVNAKLIRRHPHVFGDAKADKAFEAKQNWEAAKHAEKARKSRLDGVPLNLPALIRAQRLQQKASYAGFDWEKVEQVWDKVHEEIQELKAAQKEGNRQHLEEEIGDVLFSVVNLARFLDISAENSLRRTSKKFTRRFSLVEQELKRRGKQVEDSDLAEMDAIWEEIKGKEKNL